MNSVHAVCDYIIARCDEADIYIDSLKLQKLLYYCQGWNLAFDRGRLFDEVFQAWIHGPVCRAVYDRFRGNSLYSRITRQDINPFSYNPLSPEDQQLVASVLEVYGCYTGDQLEYLTHMEEPWQEARRGLAPHERSENVISEATMEKCYKARL